MALGGLGWPKVAVCLVSGCAWPRRIDVVLIFYLAPTKENEVE